MDYFTIYILFCAATATSALYELFHPLMQEARALGIKNELTESPKISYFVFWCIQFIIAPAMIFVVFIPSMFNSAVIGLRRVVESEN